MKKKFYAKPGSRMSDKDAIVIGKRIDELSKKKKGQITPSELLDDAKFENSPIHNYFEWDDYTAAYQFRLHQARNILNSIVIEYKDCKVRAYHNVYIEASDEHKYVSLEEAIRSPELWEQVIINALNEASRWSERYKTYDQLAPIVDSIQETKSKLNKNLNLNL